VFEAELLGAALGAKLPKMERKLKYLIAANNTAAIQTTRHDNPMSGKYLVGALHRQMEGVVAHQPGAKVVMRWVPGNEPVPDNKRADEEAARGASSNEHLECRGTIP
jgi:ribonuclease HI